MDKRNHGIPTLFSVALAVERIETQLVERELHRAEREEALRQVIKQTIAEALAPTSARVDALQKKADRAQWMGAGAAAVVSAGFWLAKALGLV